MSSEPEMGTGDACEVLNPRSVQYDFMETSDIREFSSYNQAGYSRSGNGAANNGGGTSSLQTIGAILRDHREVMGASLAEVEKATRIRQKYLAALEADEWHLLPGEVVGRGFLRNYANYLQINANDLMDRRRATTDGDLARALSKTSAGATLPPVRDVDYRPKDVDLEETPVGSRLSEYLAIGRDWFAPVVAVIAVILVAAMLFWGINQMSDELALALGGLRERATTLLNRDTTVALAPESNPTTAASDLEGTGGAVVEGSGDSGGRGLDTSSAEGDPASSNPAIVVDATATNTPEPPTPEPPTPTPELPTATPTVEPPTATFTPEPPTATPEPPTPTPIVPTATLEPPTPTPVPVIAAANCPDPGAAITSPGVNQLVSGVVPIVGSASNPQFNFYKLEYAPGANAEGGYGYFDGTSAQVQGGVLGRFNSTAVPNGAYTIQLTVVDMTGNYPPPCRVTIQVQN